MRLIPQNNRRKRTMLLTSVLCLIVLFAGAAYAIQSSKTEPLNVEEASKSNNSDSSTKPETTVDLEPPTQQQIDAATKAKEEFLNKHSSQDNTPYSIAVTSSALNGDTYQIRTIITPSATSGNCVLSLQGADGKVISQNAAVQTLSGYTVCQGFDIPANTLQGTSWTGSIEFTSDNHRTSTNINVSI